MGRADFKLSDMTRQEKVDQLIREAKAKTILSLELQQQAEDLFILADQIENCSASEYTAIMGEVKA